MEYRRNRKRQTIKRRLLRALVIAAIYVGLMAGAVTLFLGSVWVVRNTVYGWSVMLMLCIVMGVWMFFCLNREEAGSRRVRYS